MFIIKSYKQLLKSAPLIVCFFIASWILSSCSSSDQWQSKLKDGYEKDLRIANDKLAADSSNAQAWVLRGNAYSQMKEYLSAIASYEQAIKLNPEYIKAIIGKGSSLKALNQLKEALVCYDSVVKIVPNHVRAWVERGTILDYLDRYEEAIASLDQAIAFQSDERYVWTKRMYSFTGLSVRTDDLTLKSAYLAEAVRSADRAKELYRIDSAVDDWIGRADSLGWKLSKDSAQARIVNDAALVAINMALSKNPNCKRAELKKGRVLERKGQYEDALACYTNIIVSYENHQEWTYFEGYEYSDGFLCGVLEGRADLFVMINRREEAINDLKRAISLIPNDESDYISKSKNISEKLKKIRTTIDSVSQ